MGLVSKNGKPKKAISVFQDFNPTKNIGNCLCLDNYYNYSESDVFLLKGTSFAPRETEGVLSKSFNIDVKSA